jgi:hypothetical protein
MKSWLKQNPDYLKLVPADLKEVAIIKSGIATENAGAGSAQTVSIN